MTLNEICQEKKFVAPNVAVGTRSILAYLVFWGLASAIALPPITLGGVSVYLVTFVSPILFLLVLLLWLKAPYFHRSSIAPLALGVMVILSAVASWTFGFSSPNSRDIIEAIKYLQFFPYLLALVFLAPEDLKIVHRIIVFCSFIVLVVGFIQVFQLPFIFNRISVLYLGADSVHLDTIRSGYRITITGSDPNIGGVIAAFFCVYYISLFFLLRNFKYMFASFLFLYLCVLTQSRTALIALFISFSFYYFFFYRANYFTKILVLFSMAGLVISLVFFLNLDYVYLGLRYALEGSNNSLNVRLENMQVAIQRFLDSPILGMGPAKSEFSTIIDSEYSLILQRYGMIGVFVFGGYVLYLYRLARYNVKSQWGITLLMFTAMSIFVMVTNNIFSGYQLMSIVVILHTNGFESKRTSFIM